MSRLRGVGTVMLYHWIRKYSSISSNKAIVVEASDSRNKKEKQLEKRIADLERALERKQIELDYHTALLSVLEENGIAVPKKAPASKPSADSSSKSDEPE